MPQRRAGPAGSAAILVPGGASTTSRISSPMRKKAWRRDPPGVSPSRRRRRSRPASRRTADVRSRSGLMTTRWSIERVPLGWGPPAAGGASDARVSRPSRSSSLRSRTDQATMPRPGPPSSRRRTVPTSQTPPFTSNPAAAQGSGGGGDEELVDGRGRMARARKLLELLPLPFGLRPALPGRLAAPWERPAPSASARAARAAPACPSAAPRSARDRCRPSPRPARA